MKKAITLLFFAAIAAVGTQLAALNCVALSEPVMECEAAVFNGVLVEDCTVTYAFSGFTCGSNNNNNNPPGGGGTDPGDPGNGTSGTCSDGTFSASIYANSFTMFSSDLLNGDHVHDPPKGRWGNGFQLHVGGSITDPQDAFKRLVIWAHGADQPEDVLNSNDSSLTALFATTNTDGNASRRGSFKYSSKVFYKECSRSGLSTLTGDITNSVSMVPMERNYQIIDDTVYPEGIPSRIADFGPGSCGSVRQVTESVNASVTVTASAGLSNAALDLLNLEMQAQQSTSSTISVTFDPCHYGHVEEQRYKQSFTVWEYMPNWLGDTPNDLSSGAYYYPETTWYNTNTFTEDCSSCD